MKTTPVIVFSAIIAVAAFLIGKIGCSSHTVKNNVEYVCETETVHDSVSYPVDRPIPVYRTKTVTVTLKDMSSVDSMAREVEKMKQDCEADYTKLMAQLEIARASGTEKPEVEFPVREFMDSISGEGWKAVWNAKVMGILTSMDLNVDLAKKTMFEQPKSRASFWLSGGVLYMKDGTVDVPIGIEVQKGKWAVSPSYLPVNRGAQLNIKRSIN